MTTIATALQAVKKRVAQAAAAAGRKPQEVTLLAVSKSWPAQRVREAYAAGQIAFGENYVQEGIRKVCDLADLPLKWHFVGPVQSNKTRPIAEHFTWVHSVDREKIATRLSAARPEPLPPLQVCLQVNVSGEPSKSGVSPQDVLGLAKHVRSLPRIQLRGLMTIPRPTSDPALQREQFRTLRRLLDQLNTAGMGLDTLSMGMSDDLEAAIAEGATIVRIGTAIFGDREKR